jgi:hypothetical protein
MPEPPAGPPAEPAAWSRLPRSRSHPAPLWEPRTDRAHDVFIAQDGTREGRRKTALISAWRGRQRGTEERRQQGHPAVSRYTIRQAQADAVYAAGAMKPSIRHANSTRQSKSALALTRQRVKALDGLSHSLDEVEEVESDLRNLLAHNRLPRTQKRLDEDPKWGEGGGPFALYELETEAGSPRGYLGGRAQVPPPRIDPAPLNQILLQQQQQTAPALIGHPDDAWQPAAPTSGGGDITHDWAASPPAEERRRRPKSGPASSPPPRRGLISIEHPCFTSVATAAAIAAARGATATAAPATAALGAARGSPPGSPAVGSPPLMPSPVRSHTRRLEGAGSPLWPLRSADADIGIDTGTAGRHAGSSSPNEGGAGRERSALAPQKKWRPTTASSAVAIPRHAPMSWRDWNRPPSTRPTTPTFVASLTSHRQAGLAVGRAAKMNHSHAAQLPTEWMASLRSSSTDAVLLRIPHTYGGHQPTANPRIAPDGELMHTKYVATNKRH